MLPRVRHRYRDTVIPSENDLVTSDLVNFYRIGTAYPVPAFVVRAGTEWQDAAKSWIRRSRESAKVWRVYPRGLTKQLSLEDDKRGQ